MVLPPRFVPHCDFSRGEFQPAHERQVDTKESHYVLLKVAEECSAKTEDEAYFAVSVREPSCLVNEVPEVRSEVEVSFDEDELGLLGDAFWCGYGLAPRKSHVSVIASKA